MLPISAQSILSPSTSTAMKAWIEDWREFFVPQRQTTTLIYECIYDKRRELEIYNL